MFNTKMIIGPVKSLGISFTGLNWVKYSFSIILLSMFLNLVPIASNFNLNTVKAQNWSTVVNEGGLDTVGEAYGGGAPKDIRMVIVDMIRVILGFLGIIATVIILYAGFKWMTSQGNEEEVGAAKKMLTAGVIGLAIILASYAIASYTISFLVGATTGAPVFN